MFSIGGTEAFARFASGFSDDAREICAANAQGALIIFGKDVSGEKTGRERGIRGRQRSQEFAD